MLRTEFRFEIQSDQTLITGSVHVSSKMWLVILYLFVCGRVYACVHAYVYVCVYVCVFYFVGVYLLD